MSHTHRGVVGASTVITLRVKQLDIVAQLPDDMKDTGVAGLLGNFNGITADDHTSRTGEIIDLRASERTIHYDFAETCKCSCCCRVHLLGLQPFSGNVTVVRARVRHFQPRFIIFECRTLYRASSV